MWKEIKKILKKWIFALLRCAGAKKLINNQLKGGKGGVGYYNSWPGARASKNEIWPDNFNSPRK